MLAESVAKATVATGTQAGRRLSSRDLMTEAERILHKTSGGLSLFERLERDQSLRDSLMEIVTEMQDDNED